MRVLLLLVTGFFLASGAYAATSSVDDWNYETLRDDLRLTALFQHDVQSMDDRRIGRLRDVLIGDDGEIESAVIEFDAGSGSGGFAIALFEWSEAALEPADASLTVSVGQDDQSQGAFGVQGVPAREIIGRRVLLEDDDQFGRVTDILLDRDSEQPSALLVEAGQHVYALPLRAGDIQTEGPLRYGLSRQAVERLGAFDVRDAGMVERRGERPPGQ